ncbi:class I SAM-dependent methyltransferase, partial [Candidatus Bathyarchaeota archaeon]|nr:class I SAM-dependent methyltransferase [Candidatus Bathyarchaeota archaeon]
MSKQKDRVREAFTKQASSYSSSAIIFAEEARRGFVNFVGTHPNDRVLDIATGPGFLALLFAEKVAAVVGVDLTAAMVERAEATRLKKGLSNICFQEGNAESLSFTSSSFDVATCGSAFHHFSDP